MVLSLLRNGMRAYDRSLKARPLLTKALSCAGIFTFTDVTSQFLLKKASLRGLSDSEAKKRDAQPLDLVHSVKFGVLFGGMWAGPLFHTFFNCVYFMPVPVRIFFQCITVDPLNIPVCMFTQNWLKGGADMEAAKEAATIVQDNFVSVYKRALSILPFGHVCMNFLVPVQYRTLWTSCQAYCWNTHLCFSMGGSSCEEDKITTSNEPFVFAPRKFPTPDYGLLF